HADDEHEHVDPSGIPVHLKSASPDGWETLGVSRRGYTLFNVPFGKTAAIVFFCTLIVTLSANSTVTYWSPTSLILPSSPPPVTTSSPAPSDSIIWRCSFCRFACGRVSRKDSTANIRISGMKKPKGSACGASACAQASCMTKRVTCSMFDLDLARPGHAGRRKGLHYDIADGQGFEASEASAASAASRPSSIAARIRAIHAA